MNAGMVFDKSGAFGPDEPVDLSIGETLGQAAGGGHSLDDVAERGWLNYQNFFNLIFHNYCSPAQVRGLTSNLYESEIIVKNLEATVARWTLHKSSRAGWPLICIASQ